MTAKRPMTSARLRQLMDAAAAPEPIPAGPMADPRIRAVLLRLREDVAQATERAYRELDRLGVDAA
jgi:hypothetical protein